MAASKKRPVARRRSRHFLFLDLPPELRNIIYDLLLHYNGVDRYYKRWILQAYDYRRATRLRGSWASSLKEPPSPRRRTPSILLVTRQIYAEAITILRKKPLVFSFGAFTQPVTHVITAETLRHVQHIVITDFGVQVQSQIMPEILRGHLRLASTLTDVLKRGHSLKRLSMQFHDPGMRLLSDNPHDFQRNTISDWTDRIMDSWSRVAIIKQVDIGGWMPSAWTATLRSTLTTKPFLFLQLPLKIRDRIYGLLVHWAGPRSITDHLMANRESTPAVVAFWRQPSILLTNRQINEEATRVLHSKELMLRFDSSLDQRDLTSLGSCTKPLANIQFLHIAVRVQHSESVVSGLKNMLLRQNSLQRLVVTFDSPCRDDGPNIDASRAARVLAKALIQLTELPGAAEVMINSTLPGCSTKLVEDDMQAAPGNSGHALQSGPGVTRARTPLTAPCCASVMFTAKTCAGQASGMPAPPLSSLDSRQEVFNVRQQQGIEQSSATHLSHHGMVPSSEAFLFKLRGRSTVTNMDWTGDLQFATAV